MHHHHHTMIVG